MQMSIQINITGEVVTEEKEGSFHGACLPVQPRTESHTAARGLSCASQPGITGNKADPLASCSFLRRFLYRFMMQQRQKEVLANSTGQGPRKGQR